MVAKKPKPNRVPPVSADRLIRGWDGPAGTVIRLARPEDVPQMRALVDAAGLPLDDGLADDLATGRTGSAILLGLRRGPDAMLRPLVEAAAANNPRLAMSGLVLALVAVVDGGQLVGALTCLPPGNVMSEAIDAGVAAPLALIGAARIAKVQALAVAASARGHRLGETMLRRAARLFFQLDYFLVYGQFGVGTGLDAYYTSQGFAVHDEGAKLDLDRISIPVLLGARPGERLFTRWRPR
jgi:ribosomal protein S18 acetylase RimI-like enzyme